MKKERMDTESAASGYADGRRGQFRRELTSLGSLRVLCTAAMMAAMAVVLAYLAKLIFGTGPIRVTFENLPIIFSGMAFGPLAGGLVAVVADLASCLVAGQSPNPLISVGSLSIGLIAGVAGRYLFRRRNYGAILLTELAAQLIGSVVIKSVALHTFGYAWLVLLPRLPLYIGIAVLESLLLWALFRNRQITGSLERMMKK